MTLAAAGAVAAAAVMFRSPQPAAHADDTGRGAASGSLEQPGWQIGDRWVLETLTERIQGRETKPAGTPPRIRWEFQVTKLEKVSGRDCYRVDIQCLATGRMQPRSTIWCEKETLFLRQFQTQVAVEGQYRTIQESYDCAKGESSPVLASINAVPLAMPAFVRKGAKSIGTFAYQSQPFAAGVKDTGMIRFAHTITQKILPPGAKSLEQLPRSYSKDLESRPVTEVRLANHQQAVTQLWKKGAPWPVYAENGRTQAWLVSTSRP
jgi:hypothetical protein